MYVILMEQTANKLGIPLGDHLLEFWVLWLGVCIVSIYYVEKWIDLFGSKFDNEENE